MSVSTTADTRQERARKNNLISSSAHESHNMTIEEQKSVRIIPTEALREWSISVWPSYMKGLHLVPENTITSA